MAKERAAAKDYYVNESIHDLLDLNNSSLLTMSSCIGVDLGCTMDLMGHNIEIMRTLAIARLDRISGHDSTIDCDMLASS